MKVGYVSIQNAVLDWVQDNDLGQEEIDQALLIKWASDCVRWCRTDQQLKHRIAILQIQNSRARLPEDFDTLCQAASNEFERDPCDCNQHPKPDCCGKKSAPKNNRTPRTRREDIVQWVQGTLEEDCQLEINLVCPTCHKTSCSCDTPVVEVDVDRIWEMANPQIYYSHFTRMGKFGSGPGQNSPYSSYYTPKFKLMRYSSNEYFKLTNILTGCPNVNCDNCWKEFVLDLPYIEVDFEEGEVLLSYLGKALDEDGEIMIPDHPDVFESIVNHLDFKWYRMQWKKSKDQAARAISQEAMQLRDLHMGYAKAALEIPEFQQFKSWMETSAWHKRIPRWSTDAAGRPVEDLAYNYKKKINGM